MVDLFKLKNTLYVNHFKNCVSLRKSDSASIDKAKIKFGNEFTKPD